MFRLVITGSRSWNDKNVIVKELLVIKKKFGKDVVLVSGHNPKGADALCEEVADAFNWSIETYPPEWRDENGNFVKSAAFKRNSKMLADGADACLAFHKNNSEGTAHAVKTAQKLGIPTKVVTSKTETLKGYSVK